MRIIKLEIERASEKGIQVIRYAVSLDSKRYQKIGRFITYVKKVCKLDDLSYGLELDGFLISSHDKTKALKQNIVYRMRIDPASRKDYQMRSSPIQESDNDEIAQIKPKRRQQRSHSEKKSKKQQIAAKIIRKTRKQQSSQGEQSSSSSEKRSQQSSPSHSDSSSTPKKQKHVIKRNAKIKSSSEDQKPKQSLKKIQQQGIKKSQGINRKKINQVVQRQLRAASSSSDSSSSEESDQNLPTLTQKKQVTLRIPQQKPKPINQSQKINNDKPKPFTNSFINPQKKAVIDADSSSESEPSEYQPIKRKEVIPQTTPKIQNKKPEAVPDSQEIKPKNEMKIPPALRNKIVKKTFEKHKENQWISIEKQKLKAWKQSGNKFVCQVNNKIRFKIVQLDQQKFVPIKSGWITGEVKEMQESGIVNLIKVQQEGKPYRQAYDIPERNMDELQLNRLLATKEQIEFFDQKQPQAPKQDIKPRQENKEVQLFDPSNQKNSIEKYICGQTNYYFSDKNYSVDLFMQMHANRHPQKYLNLSILLNFPKIKKFLKDGTKLEEYLKADQKYDQRTYEIDFANKLIRKKGIVKPASESKAPENNEENVEAPARAEESVEKGQIN